MRRFLQTAHCMRRSLTLSKITLDTTILQSHSSCMPHSCSHAGSPSNRMLRFLMWHASRHPCNDCTHPCYCVNSKTACCNHSPQPRAFYAFYAKQHASSTHASTQPSHRMFSWVSHPCCFVHTAAADHCFSLASAACVQWPYPSSPYMHASAIAAATVPAFTTAAAATTRCSLPLSRSGTTWRQTRATDG